jgi:hypothetical protein
MSSGAQNCVSPHVILFLACGCGATMQVADNCGQSVEPHLDKLMPFLLSTIDDPKPLIRSISCWAVSKYKPWIVAQPVESGVLGMVLGKFLERCLDNNKRVQEAAISVRPRSSRLRTRLPCQAVYVSLIDRGQEY